MKKRIVLMGLAGLALGVSADVLQEWTFDEAVGTSLQGLNNSGTPGDAAWSQTWTAQWATDGNGNLNLVPGITGYQTSSAFAALSGSDTYSFEVTSGPWSAVTGTGTVNFQSKLGGGVEIYTIVSETGGLTFKFKADGNYQDVNVTSALSGTTEHTARIDFNIAAGTAAFFVDDADVTGSWLDLTGLTFDNATTMTWQKSGDFATADPATVMKISSQSLSVIPEPATLGLISAVGIGLLAARRFFII